MEYIYREIDRCIDKGYRLQATVKVETPFNRVVEAAHVLKQYYDTIEILRLNKTEDLDRGKRFEIRKR